MSIRISLGERGCFKNVLASLGMLPAPLPLWTCDVGLFCAHLKPLNMLLFAVLLPSALVTPLSWFSLL